MTFNALSKLIEIYNIPKDVVLLSDSGWECDATNMNGVYYNSKENEIVFTQKLSVRDYYYKDPDWTPLYGEFWSFDIKDVNPKILERLKKIKEKIEEKENES